MGDTEDGQFLAKLAIEVRQWRSQGLISQEQAAAILDSYRGKAGVAAVDIARGRLISILAVLGTILVGIGIILFFAANWDAIAKPIRLALVMACVPGAYGAAYWMRYVKGYERVGAAFILLAAIVYGAAIHLVAQIYNFPLNDPSLFTYWFAGVAPIAYLTRSQPAVFLTIGLALGATGFWLYEYLGDTGSQADGIFSISVFAMLGLGLYGLGRLQGIFRDTIDYAWAFQIMGTLTVLFTVYLLGFRSAYDGIELAERIDPGAPIGLWALLCVFSAIGLVTQVAVYVRSLCQGRTVKPLSFELIASVLMTAAVFTVLFAPHGKEFTFPLVFNLLLLVAIIGLVVLGYVRAMESFINIGLAFFALDVVTRYFELSWDLLDRSLVFVVAGVILLAGGFFLERGRRKVFERMTSRDQDTAGSVHEP